MQSRIWSMGLGICSLFVCLLANAAGEELALSWTNNLLTISGTALPGGKLEILYLEAFCRKGSTDRDWHKTVLPHRTVLVSAKPSHLRFRTSVTPRVEVLHEVIAERDEVRFQFDFKNLGEEPVDLEWFQPACIRVARFTGLDQTNYVARSFIFTRHGLTRLDKIERREEALYHGGQVYVPEGINLQDVNPRPISAEQPVNGLIGCFSEDGRYLLANAWNTTHELFQGVFVCLHSDPHVGGLKPGEEKHISGKLYLLKNDPEELLRRYRKDFPRADFRQPGTVK